MRALPLALACLLAAVALPSAVRAADGWCEGPVCLQTCTAREEVCIDPEACRSGDAERWGECVDATRECLDVGEPCGPPP